MNRQTAIGLVVGCILALLTALLTSETRYYNLYDRKEIPQARYEYILENNGINGVATETHFNNTLIVLAFLGGLGLGHIFSDKIEGKVSSLSKKYQVRKKSLV